MPKNPLEIQKTPLINLAAKMDSRSNNEILDWSLNQSSIGLPLVYLQNQDLFYTKSISSREGVIDICGGVIGTLPPQPVYSVYSGTGTVNGLYPQPIFLNDGFPDREGLLINFPASGSGYNDFIIYGGAILLQDTSPTTNVIEAGYDISVQIYLAEVGATGQQVSTFFDTNQNQNHSIALNGNYNLLYNAPQLSGSLTYPSANGIDPTPLAISAPIIVNFGNSTAYTPQNVLNGSGLGYTVATPFQKVEYSFTAPLQLNYNTTYYLYIVASNTSGTSSRGLQVQTVFDNTDDQPNIIYANKFSSTVSGTQYTDLIRPIEDTIIISGINITGIKSFLSGEVDQYIIPPYICYENTSVSIVSPLPISGAFTNPDINVNTIQFNNYLQAPNSQPLPQFTNNISTVSAEFGQSFIAPSGVYSIYGGNIFANTWSNTYWDASSITNAEINVNNYNCNYICNFYQVFNTSGNQSSGNLTYSCQLLTSFSGNYLFDNANSYQNSYYSETQPGAGINSNLNQISSLFPNPVSISGTGDTLYLMTWQFLNPLTGLPLTDFETETVQLEIATNVYTNYYEFASPILIGMNNNLNPTGLSKFVRKEANGFQAYTNDYSLAFNIYSFPLESGITSVYDYRVGDSRSQAVMITRGPNELYFELDDPTTQYLIYSSGVLPSGSVGYNDAKWGHCTFQDLLFSHQYGLVSGICWDQIYSQPSGNWTQLHGLQPVFSGNCAEINLSGINIPGYTQTSGISSGSQFSIIASTSILSGGYRASVPLTVSGTTDNTYQIYGVKSVSNQATAPYDIYHVSGLAATGITTSGMSQYQFDVFSEGTYIWATQNSGNVYFLAPLCDSSGIILPNPIPNNNSWNLYPPYASDLYGTTPSGQTAGSGTYIFDITFSGANANYVANIIDYPQTYLTEQIPVPKFKKMLVWNNLLLGIGDPENPSRLWVSQQGCPQIYGTLGDIDFYYVDIDVDNGQELTGMEIFKGYLILFKENSTYLAQYTSTAGAYFQISQIDNTYGNLSIFSTVSTSQGVYALSQYGPIVANWYGCKPIGNEIIPFFNTIDHTNLIYSVAIHYADRGQILWSISNENESLDNQTGLVYSYLENAWGIRQNGMWNCAGNIGDVNNFSLLMIGDTLGQIKQINSGIFGDDILLTTPIQIELLQNVDLAFETPWLNFENSENLKQLKTLRINCQDSNQILKIDVYYNQNENIPVYSRYLNMSVPVSVRVVSLAGLCRTVKFIISSVGTADQIKLNSIQLTYIDRDQNTNLR